ncbi:MAG: epoxyqueuosine reductase QueH [Lachnospiraceae bacterium]|nr:epoxyqueuosine reductase QueH [Lachnospiraceae bacterium]
MNRINYQSVMEQEIAMLQEQNRVPRLLLHSCCGPCSSFCIKSLSDYFYVTVYYYNPNIYPPEEYALRAKEQERFIKEFPTKYPVSFVEGRFDPQEFYQCVKGLENLPEGGERCFRCYQLRLEDTVKYAKENKFDYFTTTLSISPLKNAQKLNEIGGELANAYGVPYLFSDFKKKDGYKQSTLIAKEYDMYRQYYCGCIFSKKQRDEEIAKKQSETTA